MKKRQSPDKNDKSPPKTKNKGKKRKGSDDD